MRTRTLGDEVNYFEFYLTHVVNDETGNLLENEFYCDLYRLRGKTRHAMTKGYNFVEHLNQVEYILEKNSCSLLDKEVAYQLTQIVLRIRECLCTRAINLF